jgi:hypothetical protein
MYFDSPSLMSVCNALLVTLCSLALWTFISYTLWRKGLAVYASFGG